MQPTTIEPNHRISTAQLRGVAETCLIPLAVRAQDALRPAPILGDAQAQRIVARIDADWDALRLPEPSARAALVRAREIDRYVEAFLAEGGRTVVVSIGSGLDTRLERLSGRPAAWFDLDLPEIAALRQALIPDTGIARTLAGSFLDPGWLDAVRPAVQGARVLLVAEGVLNYLPTAPLAVALEAAAAALGSCTLVADVMGAPFAAAARFLGAIEKTGAGVAWGASSAAAAARLLGVEVTSLRRYLRPDDLALGPSRHLYRIPILRDMSRLLEARVSARMA